MDYFRSPRGISGKSKVAFVTIVAILSWTLGLSFLFTSASAAQVTSFSATASSSVPSANTNYRVQWTGTTTVTVGQTIKITFDPGNSNFDLGSLTVNDVIATGSPTTTLTVITGACGVVTNDQVSINGGISNAAGDKSITLTACGSITPGTKYVYFINSHVTNPATPGSYIVRVVSGADSGDTRVAIVSAVTVTASVNTTLSFTVAGVASGQSVNGTTTSTTTSATAIGFGVLASGTPVVAAQDLTVTTNAGNGYVVTVHETQNLLSGSGADIDLFQNGSNTATPASWTAPAATFGVENTYGHFGVTSDDSDLNAGEFISNKWAGDFYATTTRTIMSHNGPADGLTQDIGKARIGYQIQISALQEAATDYSNQLIYICTPTF